MNVKALVQETALEGAALLVLLHALSNARVHADRLAKAGVVRVAEVVALVDVRKTAIMNAREHVFPVVQMDAQDYVPMGAQDHVPMGAYILVGRLVETLVVAPARVLVAAVVDTVVWVQQVYFNSGDNGDH